MQGASHIVHARSLGLDVTPAILRAFLLESGAMWLKPVIVIVFFALLVSLASGLAFLFKDRGEGKRTLYALGIRVTLAGILLALITYGVLSGKLQSKAPWSKHLDPLLQQQNP
jgi:hypothetical protein